VDSVLRVGPSDGEPFLVALEPLARVLAAMDNKQAADYFYDILDQGLRKTTPAGTMEENHGLRQLLPRPGHRA